MWLANSLNRLGHYLTGSSLSLFVLALAISGCASHTGTVAVDEYNAHPLTVAIPANVSVEFVELAMVRTLNGRDWVVQSQGPEKVVGKLVHRGYNATVTMLADQSVVRIMCDATQTNPSTGEVSPAVPIGWLENLQKDLNAQLSTGQ